MSATTEELLFQIVNLEMTIEEYCSQGRDVSSLQEQLTILREKFHSLNETLKTNSNLLKG